MPYKEREITKLYYSISEVAEMFEVNTSLIRFWEKEFNELRPKKNNKGTRLFTAEDIKNLKLIYNLVKEQGLTLEGAKRYLKENKKQLKHELKVDKKPTFEIENKLKALKEKLISLQKTL